MSSEDPTVALPRRLIAGRYELQQELGAGGFGAVHRALDRRLERTVAIKTLHQARAISAESRERFLREARTTARLQHENAIALHDAGENGDELFLVLEYVEGESLAQLSKQGPLDAATATSIVTQIARALAAAHALGIVHRDIKPANILVRADGRVKVADFGVALLAGDADLTRDGAVVGTPKYMSPEQLEGDPVGPRSDLFSLGCVAYEMLTGTTPFEGQRLSEVMANIVGGNVRPLPQEMRDRAPALASVIEQLLRRDPAERPASADDVVAQLEGGVRTTKTARNLGFVLAAVVALVILVTLALTWQARRSVVRNVPVKNASAVDRLIEHSGAVLSSSAGSETRGSLRLIRKKATRMAITDFAAKASEKGQPIRFTGLSFYVRRGGGKEVQIRAPNDQIDEAARVVALFDALHGRSFRDEPNRIRGDGQSDRLVSVAGREPHRIIEIVAAAAGWRLVVDPSAEEAVERRLVAAGQQDIRVRAPWDDIVKSLMQRYELATYRIGDTWLLVSVQRLRELELARPLVAVTMAPSGDLDAAARALAAASSARGSVLINRRVHMLVISDTQEVVERQRKIIEMLDQSRPPAERPQRSSARSYSGDRIDLHLHQADVRHFLGLIARITGVNLIVDPDVKGTLTTNLRSIPWDEAMDVALHLTRNTFKGDGTVLEIVPEAAKPREEIVVETVKLRHEDPRFFQPWARVVAPGGKIVIEEKARLLIIRDTRSNAESFKRIAESIDGMLSRKAGERIVGEITHRGLRSAVALQQRLQATDDDYDFAEGEWNQVGYALLGRDPARALEVFRWNAAKYPQSWNAYDSLAEAQMIVGDRAAAAENYRKSLRLNPKNHNAARKLRELERFMEGGP